MFYPSIHLFNHMLFKVLEDHMHAQGAFNILSFKGASQPSELEMLSSPENSNGGRNNDFLRREVLRGTYLHQNFSVCLESLYESNWDFLCILGLA